MCLIDHQNVVKAYCCFVVEQSLWVVMPYMAGGSFLHIMKSAFPEGFDEPVIATVLKESLKALEYLHRHGHIHRDVKVPLSALALSFSRRLKKLICCSIQQMFSLLQLCNSSGSQC